MKAVKLKEHGVHLLQGNEACAYGAIAANCRFFAGYPITPASEIPEILSSVMFKAGGSFVQMEDELASIGAIVGASCAGIRSMTATSGPGFSLMQETLGYAIETEVPIVILDVQRGGPSTGQPTASSQQDVMQSRYGTHGDYSIIVLTPASVQECFDFTVRAFNLADEYRVPVIILSDEAIGHLREKIVIPETVDIFNEHYQGICREYYRPDERLIPPRIHFYEGHSMLLDGQHHDERSIRAGHKADVSAALVQRLCDKIETNADKITSVQKLGNANARISVIAYGSVSRSAKSAVVEALRSGVDVNLLKLDTLWPVPENHICAFCERAERIIVPEMNAGQYVKEIGRILGSERVIKLTSLGGVLHTPEMILQSIKEVYCEQSC